MKQRQEELLLAHLLLLALLFYPLVDFSGNITHQQAVAHRSGVLWEFLIARMIAVFPSGKTALISTGDCLTNMTQMLGEYKAKDVHFRTWTKAANG